MKIDKKRMRKIVIVLLGLAVLGLLTALFINGYVKAAVKDRILNVEKASELKEVDCIIILGCGVYDDGSLSPMLRDRLIRGLELYKEGAAPKILMSGDHGRKEYDEVNAMKQYAIDNGVLSENIFMDHAGFSTYETIYRAKEIFEAKKVIIVTQEYHLYRTLYIADQFDMEAYGVSADLNRYVGQSMRDFREILARCKDFAMCIFKPEPTFLGEVIPISGNGDLTNDK